MIPQMKIEVTRTSAWRRLLRLRDAAGDPIDLTGATIALDVKYAGGPGTVLASADISMPDPAAGEFVATVDGADFDEVPGPHEPVPLAFDIRAEQDGLATVLARGELLLLPGVTEGE